MKRQEKIKIDEFHHFKKVMLTEIHLLLKMTKENKLIKYYELLEIADRKNYKNVVMYLKTKIDELR